MRMEKLYLIPEPDNIERSEQVAAKWGAAFEYNDFFAPDLLDDKAALKARIDLYRPHAKKGLGDNLHGVFYDICLNSFDTRIRKISEERVNSSMEIAEELGCDKVIFHTNNIPGFIPEFYINAWVKKNADYYRKICGRYPKMKVCVENMFDFEPDMLMLLARQMEDVDNFGVCFDIAHINVHGKRSEDWISLLAPYIKHIHINDNDGRADLHMSVGDGTVDWEDFFAVLKKYKVTSGMLVEVRKLDDFERSMHYLTERGLLDESTNVTG